MMVSREELRFAQKYPFTLTAKKIISEQDFRLSEIPDEVIKRAKALTEVCARKEKLVSKISSDKISLKNEVLAFPTAKILVSLMRDSRLNERFSKLISNSTFKYLELEPKKRKTLLDMASELEIKFDLSDREAFFVRVPLNSFLSIPFHSPLLKLVNQKTEKGFVYLKENDFARFLSEIVYRKIFDSLPVETKSIPLKLRLEANSLQSALIKGRKKQFKEVLGRVEIDAFPPCLADVYSDLLEGKNISHQARFDLVTFLVAVGMPAAQIIELFKNAPNYNERITRYQVERIAGKKGLKYSPPNCAKIKSHQLCQRDNLCANIKHPMQYYKKRLLEIKRKTKEKK